MFNTIIYQPLLNLMVFLYQTVGFHDLGLTIIVMTLVVRVALGPLSLKTARSQKAMAELAPEVERIKEQHKGDTSAQSAAVMKLYKEKGVSPLSGCLPLLIQFPLLIGMYRVFLDIFKPDALAGLYSFVSRPASINNLSFGILDISAPYPALAIVAGILQFFQARMAAATPNKSPQAGLNRQMAYILPAVIVLIGWSLPAGLTIYWAVTTAYSMAEQLYLRSR